VQGCPCRLSALGSGLGVYTQGLGVGPIGPGVRGSRVEGLGLWGQGVGSRVDDLESKVWGLGSRVLGSRVRGLGERAADFPAPHHIPPHHTHGTGCDASWPVLAQPATLCEPACAHVCVCVCVCARARAYVLTTTARHRQLAAQAQQLAALQQGINSIGPQRGPKSGGAGAVEALRLDAPESGRAAPNEPRIAAGHAESSGVPGLQKMPTPQEWSQVP
jgi:hypothetical protein